MIEIVEELFLDGDLRIGSFEEQARIMLTDLSSSARLGYATSNLGNSNRQIFHDGAPYPVGTLGLLIPMLHEVPFAWWFQIRSGEHDHASTGKRT